MGKSIKIVTVEQVRRLLSKLHEQTSAKTERLIEEIVSYSDKPITHVYEITSLIETVLLYGKEKEFKDLIFTGKYVNGLKSVVSGRIVNKDDYMEKMFKEFNMNLQKVVDILKSIIAVSDDKIRSFFNENYFLLNQQSMLNLMGLVEDLSVCKKYFNENKSCF